MINLVGRVVAAVFLVVTLRSVGAAEGPVVEICLTGLSNPCGVAVRPGELPDRYEVFVADSGAGRIVRVWSDAPKSAVDVVTGFDLTRLGEDGLPVGPVSLLFLNHRHLVVGTSGSEGAGLHLFELADEMAAIPAEKAKQQIAIKASAKSLNHVYAIARTRANDSVRDSLVLSCFGNNQTGGLWTSIVRADTLGEPEPFDPGEHQIRKSSPAGIAVGESGYVVVGWVGTLDAPRDSRLAFYSPLNGSRFMELSTELHDILGLAYSPQTGNLYAADAAWMDAENGGVFRIDAAGEPGTSKTVAIKVADVLRPTALAFGPDGALYVTAFGNLNDSAPQGMLLKITNGL